jgi:hypothetical protein
MRNDAMNARSALALLLCGLIAAAGCVAGASAAFAFGRFGFGPAGGSLATPGLREPVRPPPGRWRPQPLPHGGIIGGYPGRGFIPGGAGRPRGTRGRKARGAVALRRATPFVRNEIITAFAPNVTAPAIDRLARRYRLRRLESQTFALISTRLYRWRIDSRRSVAGVVRALARERIVASVQPNYLFTLQTGPAHAPVAMRGDPAQYALGELQIAQAQRIATGKDVRIAVIDSEIDAGHPDLSGTVVKSFDALGRDDRPHGHGTSIAGAIAAHGKLLGIAPRARILAIHAFDDTPGRAQGTSFDIAKGLQWAADNAARIVNMSFAGPADPLLQRMLAAAYARGIILIAAAGNGGPHAAPLYPAAYRDVIAVTATDSDDHLFKLANRGRYIAVAAPGVDILALAPGDAYAVTSGTSIAAAQVTGIAALLLERDPALKPGEIRSVLIATAKPLGPARPNAEFGSGLVNAYRAVTWLARKPAALQRSGAQAQQ